MNNNYSNGPNGWAAYNISTGNGGFGNNQIFSPYPSDTDVTNTDDGLYDDLFDPANPDGSDADISGMSDILQYDFNRNHNEAFANAMTGLDDILPDRPTPNIRPPPLEAVWNGTSWYYPIPVPQQQHIVPQSPFTDVQQPHQFNGQSHLRQAPARLRSKANHTNGFQPRPSLLGNPPMHDSESDDASVRPLNAPRRLPKSAKKVSLVRRCICTNNAGEVVKRPMNSFFLYRKHREKDVRDKAKRTKDPENISKTISRMWKQEPQHVRDEYQALSKKVAAKHSELHPGYKYTPDAKKAADWGNEECVCGAYQANQAKLEGLQADDEEKVPSQKALKKRQGKQPTRSPGFEVNYGLPTASGKRKAPLNRSHSNSKRRRPSHPVQPQPMPTYQDGFAQPVQGNPYGGQLPMAYGSGATQGYFTSDMPVGNNSYMTQDPFAPNRGSQLDYNAFVDLTAGQQYSQLDGALFTAGDSAADDNLDDLNSSFWALDNGTDVYGDQNTELGQFGLNNSTNDLTPTQAVIRRRSTRSSAQRVNDAGTVSSPARTLRRSPRNA